MNVRPSNDNRPLFASRRMTMQVGEAQVSVNESTKQNERSGEVSEARAERTVATRESYTPPVIEKFPPMGNVTFGTNVQPTLAMTLAGA